MVLYSGICRTGNILYPCIVSEGFGIKKQIYCNDLLLCNDGRGAVGWGISAGDRKDKTILGEGR